MLKNHKIFKYLPHITAVLFLSIFPVFLWDESNWLIKFWLQKYYFHLVFFVVTFYINYLFIIPKFFLKEKRTKYILLTISMMAILIFSSQFLGEKLQIDRPPKVNQEKIFEDIEMIRKQQEKRLIHPHMLDDIFYLIMVLGFSTGMGILQNSRKNELKKKELEKNHAETELAFLRNQISPHFFFNSLNNIYALIAIDGDKAQQAVEKLSGLMRYLIYESNVETVKLQKEVEFTRNYIELMKQRLSAKVKLNVEIQEEIPDIDIAPLIFIHFIENAFKHGISYREDSFVDISLKVKDETIEFLCKNSIPQVAKPNNEEGGLGIANIKKRLELLYGSKSKLDLIQEDNVFTVNLTLPIGNRA